MCSCSELLHGYREVVLFSGIACDYGIHICLFEICRKRCIMEGKRNDCYEKLWHEGENPQCSLLVGVLL